MSARATLSSIKPSPDTTAFEAGKEVMEKLRNLHMVLGSTMESMLQVRRGQGVRDGGGGVEMQRKGGRRGRGGRHWVLNKEGGVSGHRCKLSSVAKAVQALIVRPAMPTCSDRICN